MKARLGHLYFTFMDSNCVYIYYFWKGYVKGKYAAVAMVGLGAAGAGVAALVTVIRPLWILPCLVISTGRREKKFELRSISPQSETVNRHGR